MNRHLYYRTKYNNFYNNFLESQYNKLGSKKYPLKNKDIKYWLR